MSTTQRRELAYRSVDGIEVSLFWTRPSNRVTVELFDAQIVERFEFEVDPADALDAFNHPYSYAATRSLSVEAAKPKLAVTPHDLERKP
jgi:hypothetical protein